MFLFYANPLAWNKATYEVHLAGRVRSVKSICLLEKPLLIRKKATYETACFFQVKILFELVDVELRQCR